MILYPATVGRPVRFLHSFFLSFIFIWLVDRPVVLFWLDSKLETVGKKKNPAKTISNFTKTHKTFRESFASHSSSSYKIRCHEIQFYYFATTALDYDGNESRW